jgi:hypothetical protein
MPVKCFTGRVPNDFEVVSGGIVWVTPTTVEQRDFISEKVFGPDNVTIESRYM